MLSDVRREEEKAHAVVSVTSVTYQRFTGSHKGLREEGKGTCHCNLSAVNMQARGASFYSSSRG